MIYFEIDIKNDCLSTIIMANEIHLISHKHIVFNIKFDLSVIDGSDVDK